MLPSQTEDSLRRFFAILAGALALGAVPLLSQNSASPSLAGTWQGKLNVGGGMRVVLHISPDAQAGWKGELLSIDQAPNPIALSSVSLNGSDFSFAVAQLNIKYHGALSADGNSIQGTFNQGGDLPLNFDRATPATKWKIDNSPHKVQFVNVDKDVKLEVLDWGGTGRPLVLLAGLGRTAHDFDKIAPKLATTFHVYGITRRGWGASSVPEPIVANYSAQRLGDDVLAVIHELKLERPIVGGHSLAGEELSYIGTDHPEEVAGLIYLDAGYFYAYYDASRGDQSIDAVQVQRDLDRLTPFLSAADARKLIGQMLTTDLPALQRDLELSRKRLDSLPQPPVPPDSPETKVVSAIIHGVTKFSTVHCPVLAIFALPHDLGPMGSSLKPEQRAALEADDADTTGAQVTAFEKGNPNAKVIVLAHASHAVFNSNEAEVLKAITEFVGTLK
jgi:non-heme chloroperoxidase